MSNPKNNVQKSGSRGRGTRRTRIQGCKLGGKTIENQSKSQVNMGRHHGIDFGSMLVDLGGLDERENRAMIVQKRHRKNDEKGKRPKLPTSRNKKS